MSVNSGTRQYLDFLADLKAAQPDLFERLDRAAGKRLSSVSVELICNALFRYFEASAYSKRIADKRRLQRELTQLSKNVKGAAAALRRLEPSLASCLSEVGPHYTIEGSSKEVWSRAEWPDSLAEFLSKVAAAADKAVQELPARQGVLGRDVDQLVASLADAFKSTRGLRVTFMRDDFERPSGSFANFLRVVWEALPVDRRPKTADAFAERARDRELAPLGEGVKSSQSRVRFSPPDERNK